MSFFRINDRLRFFIHRIRERLWVMPLAACLLSIAGVFVAKIADTLPLGHIVPQATAESVESILSIMASSMLVIATFAVGSMVSAYASVSTTASPRSFSLVVADDVSQRALSTFIGAFIFSIIGLIAAKNDFFDIVGRFVLFLLTVAMFGMVIFTFVGWVDRIARLGRLGATIEKVERATAAASLDDAAFRDAAMHHARRALAFAEKSLVLPEDLSSVRQLADFAANMKS